MITTHRWLAYAQLVRLPNVFTAFADILLAACCVGLSFHHLGSLVLLLLASGALYLSGMVWNDIFDRHEDQQYRAFRPIPSGRVSVRVAGWLAVVLMLGGIAAASWVAFPSTDGYWPWPIVLLPMMILLYDALIKHSVFGPLAMGLCRFFNVQLGFLLLDAAFGWQQLGLHVAAIVGLYIVGVTLFAKTEEMQSSRRPLALAITIILAATLLALWLPLSREAGTSPWYYPYLMVVWLVVIGVKLVPALQNPQPRLVQAAVKRCILGLVGLDAVLATQFVGWPGLLILGLLVPANYLGKQVYST